MTMSGRARQTKDALLVLNVFSVLLYSPNFMSLVFPFVKGLQLVVFVLTATYVLLRASRRLDLLSCLFLLFLGFVLASAGVNYARFENTESLYLAFSYALKALSVVMLFHLCRAPRDFDLTLKSMLLMLAAYALHGILQFVLVALGLVLPIGNIEMMGYDFMNLGWLGIYRVSLALGDWNLVRIQSFFQEPGFFAFYLLFGLVLIDCVKERMPLRHPRWLVAVFFVAMLLTMSLTGIVLMLLYLLFKTRSVVMTLVVVAVALFALDFIVFNESEFISKEGSFDMRLEHYALLADLAGSWENFLFGIGLGNDALISDMRVNNFLPELVMFSSVFGLAVMLFAIAITVPGARRSNFIVWMVLLYAISTPMLWSPLFLVALYIARYAQRDLPHRVARVGHLSLVAA